MRCWRPTLMLITLCTLMSLAASAAGKQNQYSVATVESVEKGAGYEHAATHGCRGLMAGLTRTLPRPILAARNTWWSMKHGPMRSTICNGSSGKTYDAYVQGNAMYVKSQSGRALRKPDLVGSGK